MKIEVTMIFQILIVKLKLENRKTTFKSQPPKMFKLPVN